MICESCVYFDPVDRHCYPNESESVSWCSGFKSSDPDYGSHWVPVSRFKKKDLINNELLPSFFRDT